MRKSDVQGGAVCCAFWKQWRNEDEKETFEAAEFERQSSFLVGFPVRKRGGRYTTVDKVDDDREKENESQAKKAKLSQGDESDGERLERPFM